MKQLTEALELHDTLNPKLWNLDTNLLKDDVQERLYNIAQEFIKYSKIPLNVVDIEVVGSNASYNYNDQSDIDLHIIVNSEVTYVDSELLQLFYNGRKNTFNENYDLEIEGIPVELYIEDMKASNATNGRYSLIEQNWVRFPEPITYEIPDITEQLDECLQKCTDLLQNGTAEDIDNYINEIYMMRKLGLEQDGEASIGNLVFKELRNMNMMQELRDRYYELRSEDLTK